MADVTVKHFIDKISLTQTMRQVEASMALSRRLHV